MDITNPELEKYAASLSEPAPKLLEELRERTFAEMSAPGMQTGAFEGAFLRLLVGLVQAKRVLEIGMFTGYSGLMMAEALPADGELITCDVDPKAEKIAREFFGRSEHGKKIQIRMGPALETMKSLKPGFDLVFIDADKENYRHYYDEALKLTRKNGLIVIDNTLWSGKVLAPKEVTDHAIVEFNKAVAADSRVEKVLVPLRDGVTLARKR
jgi:caffeoyl-CoA O-methyltransferase